jgi:hypothetical protein
MTTNKQLAVLVQERFLTTPVEILMEIATDPENDVKVRQNAASNAAPYVHQRLRQVEMIDNTQKTREQLEHDVTAILAKYVHGAGPDTVVATVPRGRRDLIGSVPATAEPGPDQLY